MRPSHVATTLVAVTAGLTAAVVAHRRSDRRLSATVTTTTATATATAPVEPVPDRGGVVLEFVRPVVPVPAPAQPVAPARCGDSGGRTRAGAPCAARATTGGRCHHHRLAA